MIAQRGSIITWLAPEGTLSFSAEDGRHTQPTGRFTDDAYREPSEARVKTLLQWVDERLNLNQWLAHD